MIGAKARDARRWLADALAYLRVAAHQAPFVVAQRPFLAQQMLRNTDLADVVQQRAVRHSLELLAAQADVDTDACGMMRKPAAVMDKSDVLGFDRVGQRGHDLRCALEGHDCSTQAHGTANSSEELHLLYRLREEVVGACVERGDHVLHGRVSRDDDDRQCRGQGVAAQPSADLEAVHARQRQIEQDQLWQVLDDGAHAHLAIANSERVVALAFEHAGQQSTLGNVILDDQDERLDAELGRVDVPVRRIRHALSSC